MLVALLCLPCWCLVIVLQLFLTVPRFCLKFVIVVFPDHTLFLFLYEENLARLGLISFFVAKQQATSLSIK